MSLHALAWIVFFLIFAGLTFRRSSWGIPLYLLTFYANPGCWWWGAGALSTIGNRWCLAAALIFAAGVLLDKRRTTWDVGASARPVIWVLFFYAINATLVHILFAVCPEQSWKWLDLLWKEVGLLFLMLLAIRDEFDFKLLVYSLLVGGTYICCEFYFFGTGYFENGRLEGIRLPSGSESSYLTQILSLSAILGGFLIFFGRRLERLFALFCCVLLTETILECNSRGGLLALLVGAAWLIATARARVRYYAAAGVIAAACAAFAVMGDFHREKVIGRFFTSFASDEERDPAAQSRLDFWHAALNMIGDRPLGSGGDAFKSELGLSYVPPAWRQYNRAAHNGYLDMAAGWGVQGLALYLAAIFLAWRRVRCGAFLVHQGGDKRSAFLGNCIEAALVVQLTATMFLSNLKGEWYFWWIALALAYERVFAPAEEEVPDSEPTDAREEYVRNEPELAGVTALSSR